MFGKIIRPVYLTTLVFISLLCSVKPLCAQDEKNPRAFADFLFSSKLYELAGDEYERLLYYDYTDLDLLKRLITCYTRTGKDKLLDKRYDLFQTEDRTVALSYYDLLLSTGNAKKLNELFQRQQDLFSLKDQRSVRFKIATGNYDWNEVKRLYSLGELETYGPIINKLESVKFKKPVTAALMSTLVPGLGRVYARDAKDGLISLIFVGSFGYQSYRRFDQKGVKSVGAWIYGGLALGFHVSNIYGSYQSAKYYNKKQNEKIYSFAMPYLVSGSD